jgi:hypothetical protein
VILNVVTVGLINFVKIPKFHSAICKYGASHLAPTADHWHYRGEDYYNVYDTTQEFNSSYDSGSYSILPPFYTLRTKAYHLARFREYWQTLPPINPPVCTNNKIMRLTKIYFKKVKFFAAFSLGVFAALSVCSLIYIFLLKPSAKTDSLPVAPVVSKAVSTEYDTFLTSAKIYSFDYLPNSGARYLLISGDKTVDSRLLSHNGFVITNKGLYELIIKSPSGASFFITK